MIEPVPDLDRDSPFAPSFLATAHLAQKQRIGAFDPNRASARRRRRCPHHQPAPRDVHNIAGESARTFRIHFRIQTGKDDGCIRRETILVPPLHALVHVPLIGTRGET